MSKKIDTKKILFGAMLCGGLFLGMTIMTKRKTENRSAGDVNPHKRNEGIPATIYEKYIKPAMDKLFSFIGLIALSPLFAAISLAVVLDDPGPVIFTQRRVGKDKRFFSLHKFRSMKMSTPHDMPTHQLKNPEQYITRVGRILRKTSLDELPQIWDIFRGNMSIIGPRPALWNQGDLVAERDKYGANDVRPGLTGLAQVNGRDELEIPEKARLDGIYRLELRKGSWEGLKMDCKCFIRTIKSVLSSDGVVEGGTGSLQAVGRARQKEGMKQTCQRMRWAGEYVSVPLETRG